MESIEIVFSFDTTGSMYPCLGQVRKNIEQVVGDLFKEIPNLKIGLVAHGDYCDEGRSYLTKHVDLTSDIYSLTQFARNVGPTGGGDAPEAYEHVLMLAGKSFQWTLNSRKILVMIGDDVAHEPNYQLNKLRTDWRTEAASLSEKGIKVYTIQCLGRGHATRFWEHLAHLGGGQHLQMSQFADIVTLVNAIVYQQVSKERVEQYEQKIIKSSGMTRSLDQTFSTLTGRPRDEKGRFVAYKTKSSSGEELSPVVPGRFQVMPIEEDSIIRDFVNANGLTFQPGKGFYEFTKRETIQDKKEIVIQDKVSGDMFTGENARDILGIPLGMGKGKVSPKHGDKYNVFVQSTSYNRKLIGGTRFLYEVDMSV